MEPSLTDRLTTRIGAVALPLGLIVLLVSTFMHPSHEDPMDNPAVFLEYAQSEVWIAAHLGQYIGYLLLIGGLVALYFAIAARPDAGAAVARFGLAAAVLSGAAVTILQAVDGIALKRAVDAWASAPDDQRAAAFAAAEAIRWIEIGVNGLAFFLVGLTLLLYGVGLALGSVFPRWTGWLAMAAGIAYLIHGGAIVSYQGFVPSIPGLAALALFAVWTVVMAVLMWRRSTYPAQAH